ncbi:MAG: NADH-quinone oxidoreductase subunit NuoE [Herminiimonas sp.]|nr:NADH-quinone oxidoreductase subunit NuoE [Herminiimonas sp.]
MLLSEQSYKRIDREVAKFPPEQKQSAVMSALAIAQDEQGWLSPEVMQDVADYLGMPAIAVQEVATFYTMYNVNPVGKFKISVCTNLPCALSGGEKAAQYLKQKLGIDYRETTADGQFTLQEGECMGACGDAPVMLVNNKRMCSWMSNDKIDSLIGELGAQRGAEMSGQGMAGSAAASTLVPGMPAGNVPITTSSMTLDTK